MKMTRRNIMAAILKTASPVVAHRSVNARWAFLSMLSSKQFIEAADQLVQEHFGTLKSLPGDGVRTTQIFIKTHPDSVREAIAANPDLCTLEEYTQKYNRPLPKVIKGNKREKIISMGLVADD